MKYNIHVIGAGNMGTAIIKGLLDSDISNDITLTVSDNDENKLKSFKNDNINVNDNNVELINDDTKAVLLAVKPNLIEIVLKEISPVINGKTIISIAAGKRISYLKEHSNNNQKIVRVMPNTPLQVKKGVTALCFTDNIESSEKKIINDIFATVSLVIELEEKYFDGITALSGSGPAFVLYFVNAMIDAGVKLGFSRKESEKIVKGTFNGTIELLKQTGQHPTILLENVTSPGGTTIEGLCKFDELGCKNCIVQGVLAAARRSKEL